MYKFLDACGSFIDRAGEREQRGEDRVVCVTFVLNARHPNPIAAQPLVMEHGRSFRRWQERLGDFLSRCEGSAVTDVD